MSAPSTARVSNLGLLAAAIVLPRVLYIAASLGENDGLRALAWGVDIVCLIVSALVFFPLQKQFGADDSRAWAWVASAGFLGDALTTTLGRFYEVPGLLITIGLVAWVGGVTRWLAELCAHYGAEYFIYRLWIVALIASHVVRLLQPEWPVFFYSFSLLMVGVAVQIALVARAIGKDDQQKRNISAP
ncbi:MAG: hypothetical protein Q8O67_16525 [Deltaproteobacteria bacterium]|nr:hypothetical protein [Deltaproteobacteria bacterium]